MLVSQLFFDDVIDKLSKVDKLSLDCETTGLMVHHDDLLFAISISCELGSFYFNFNSYGGLKEEYILPSYKVFNITKMLRGKTVFFANAKFDMHFLMKESLEMPEFKAWDVLVIDKCLYNQHMKYDLDSVAKRNGFEKLADVKEYIKKHKLYRDKNVPMYDQVPLDIMKEYAERDSDITYQIGLKQELAVEKLENVNRPSFKALIEDECKITRICFDMERRGVLVDEKFIDRARAHEQVRCIQAAKRYKEITGQDFVDSNKAHQQSFEKLGLPYQRTQKGSPSFSSEALESNKHEIAEVILEYRDAAKRISSYYDNFILYKDKCNVIHPNIKQAGADTFRFSITNPALQTLNSEDSGEYMVRSSFIARQGFKFVSIDYSQQEYRLTADYAGEMELIAQIKQGVDVHEATAKLMGVDRKKAKTLNFALLYGAGCQKIADQLGISLAEATKLRDKYFKALPKITKFSNEVKKTAKNRQYIFNWVGRYLHFTPYMFEGELKEVSFKAPNHLIQSGGAEIMRKAMIRIHEYLADKKSKIILSVHDQLDIEMHEEEMGLIPYIVQMMIDVYPPKNGLPMAVEYSIGQNMGEL